MPVDDRLQRLLRVVELLQSGRVYNSLQIAESLGVSRRTIFRDLRLLERAGIPVVFDEERQGHVIRSPVLLPTAEFSLDETLSLLVLCHELGNSDQGIPFHRAARTAALKLLSNLPRQLRESTVKSAQSISVRLDPRSPLDGAKSNFDLFNQALQSRRQVRVEYESFDEKQQIRTVLSPYRILFSRRSWYVIGRSSLHRQVRTFNIGRVLKAETLDSTYRIPQRFNLDRYLGDAWHLIREPRERHKVVIRFQPLVARNVAEVRWHATQKLVWREDGTLDFHVQVEGLREIQWWILGYGSQAEVIQPAKLREMVGRHVESLNRLYLQPTSSPPLPKQKRPKASTQPKTPAQKGPHFLPRGKNNKRSRKS